MDNRMASERLSRNLARTQFTETSRIILAEQDLDEHDRMIIAFKEEVRTIKTMLMGVLISASTATVVGAMNLLYQRLG
jgi:hypothetical protein